MKRKIVFSVAAGMLALCLPSVHAQSNSLTPAGEKSADMRIPELDRSALEPEKRTPVDVLPGERNPFGLLAVPPPEEKEAVKIQIETEEMKIRRILGNMRVTGASGEQGDRRVLLGSMLLGKGDTVPRLFQNQAEVLRVDDVTERSVVLSFLERKQQSDQPPRTIALGFDLQPRVRSLLPGELFTSVVKFDEKGAQTTPPIKTESVESILKQFDTNHLTEALIDHRRALLGEATYPAKYEPPPKVPEK